MPSVTKTVAAGSLSGIPAWMVTGSRLGEKCRRGPQNWSFCIAVLFSVAFTCVPTFGGNAAPDRPPFCRRTAQDFIVRLETTLGVIDVKLYGVRAPITVCNFLEYVTAGHFNGGQFFRTVRPDNQKSERVPIDVVQADIRSGASRFRPIRLERTSETGLLHTDGVISMARDAPDDATSSFFIVIGAQPELDAGGTRNADRQGFAAFGQVIQGMAVVRHIWAAPAAGETLSPPIAIARAFILKPKAECDGSASPDVLVSARIESAH